MSSKSKYWLVEIEKATPFRKCDLKGLKNNVVLSRFLHLHFNDNNLNINITNSLKNVANELVSLSSPEFKNFYSLRNVSRSLNKLYTKWNLLKKNKKRFLENNNINNETNEEHKKKPKLLNYIKNLNHFKSVLNMPFKLDYKTNLDECNNKKNICDSCNN